MPVTDPIADLLTRMRNAQGARRDACQAPWSRIKQQLCELLQRDGWITEVSVLGEEPKKELRIVFAQGKPKLLLRRESRPGRRLYGKSKELKPVLRGYGAAILTTSRGLMTDTEARKQGIGGEILCTIA